MISDINTQFENHLIKFDFINQEGFILVDSHKDSIGLVKYSNEYIGEILGLSKQTILNASINNFLP